MNNDENKEKQGKVEKPEVLRIAQEVSVDDLRENFPHLYEELKSGKKLKIDQVIGQRFEFDKNVKRIDDPLRGYEPGIMDFLARAKNDEEAHEIIDFLEKRGEILPEEANEIRDKIVHGGIRSVTEFRHHGYYFRKAEEARAVKSIIKGRSLHEEKAKGNK